MQTAGRQQGRCEGEAGSVANGGTPGCAGRPVDAGANHADKRTCEGPRPAGPSNRSGFDKVRATKRQPRGKQPTGSVENSTLVLRSPTRREIVVATLSADPDDNFFRSRRDLFRQLATD